jgi:beta-mannanase
MKQKKRKLKDDTRWIKQLFVVILLVGLPAFMIYFNGKSAISAIVWTKAKNENFDANKRIEKRKDSNYNETITNKSMYSIHYGIYDPQNKFYDYDKIKYEVVYISWLNYNSDSLSLKLRTLSNKNRVPVLVCEPWSKSDSKSDYLTEIYSAGYDSIIDRLVNILNDLNAELLISWGHEMDQDLTARYPWSGKNPEEFIKAYRYVVNYINNKSTSSIKWIWAPVVKETCVNYWPGKDFVDFIGFPVYSFPEWDISYYGYIRDFKTTFLEKYEIVKSFNTPIMINEFGVTGNSDFSSFWINQAFKLFDEYPLLHSVIYFYSADVPKAWGSNISTPDWRIDKSVITGLIDYYTQN